MRTLTICNLPMLLATGSDYGSDIVHRFTLHGPSDMQAAMQVTGLEVILSALTALEWFGTLALAVHRGIASVGLIALVGISARFLAALFTLPATLQIWDAHHHHEDYGSCAWAFSLCWRCSSSALRVQKTSATRSQERRKRPF